MCRALMPTIMPRRAGAAWIGTAGWNVPRGSSHRVPSEGTHLDRYAQVFTCAEINSSFHRPHACATYAKWAASTPEGFRFAVKLPRTITHDAALTRPAAALDRFFAETSGLGIRRGPVLVQLPPSLVFDARVADRFFDAVRKRFDGAVVCEPRHQTWAHVAAEDLLKRYRVARVAADPPRVAAFAEPSGWDGLVYLRLHGSPRVYWSGYTPEYLDRIATFLRATAGRPAWVIFDNTAAGQALGNAWELQRRWSEAPMK